MKSCLLGYYICTMDKKGRIIVPSAFQCTCDDEIGISYDGNKLFLINTNDINNIYEKARKEHRAVNIDERTIKIIVEILKETKIDNQGRINLGVEIARHLQKNEKDTIILHGIGDMIEILNEEDVSDDIKKLIKNKR